MSTYYSFYVGYKTKDGKLHAYGPFDKFGKLCPVLCKSRSFVSNLYEDFYKANIEDLDEQLTDKFVYEGYLDKQLVSLYYLPVSQLPNTNYIKSGYFLIDEIVEYLENEDEYEFDFSERYSITEYSIKLSSAVRNNDTEEIERLKKFSYFSYPDYTSKEYESFIIHQYISFNGPFEQYMMEYHLKENNEDLEERVILLDIG